MAGRLRNPPPNNGRQRRAVGRIGLAKRPVQVDHVQPARALCNPLTRRLRRVGAVHRLAGRVALFQAHHLPMPQVNRRVRRKPCQAQEIFQDVQPGVLAFFGMELHAEQTAAPYRADKGLPVMGDRQNVPRIIRLAVERVVEEGIRPLTQPNQDF